MATPSERALQARLAAHTKWATTDAREGTKPARDAFDQRFLNEARKAAEAKGEQLTDDELHRRAYSLRKAYFTRLALLSAQARRRGGDAA